MRLVPLAVACAVVLAGVAVACSADDAGTDALSGSTTNTARDGSVGGGGDDTTDDDDTSVDGSIIPYDVDGSTLPDGAPLPPGSIYPTRSAYRIKAIQPDAWPNRAELSGNNTGGIAMNMVWAAWEGAKKATPCDAANEQEYDGRCFVIDKQTDSEILEYSKLGLVVTGVVYGVPAWARRPGCSPQAAGYEVFCVSTDAADYARFAGMIATRYDGAHGHGRIADFVIHNEVNSNDWYDVGCGQGTACNTNAWIDKYSEDYKAAFDKITAAQSAAKVLISLEHSFGQALDAPAATHALLSGETFLTRFAQQVAPRAWRVAYHPYPKDLFAGAFSADDGPQVTYGNIGVIAGWLAKNFPTVPSAREIQLTESGINSSAPSSSAAQALFVCASFINVLGTPGIENYVYHRMKDNKDEGGLLLGLRDVNGNVKEAWTTWALANRNDLTPPKLSCGFENLPYTKLTRSFNASRGHWASTRIPPAGFTAENTWKLFRDAKPKSHMLYECRVGNHNMVSGDVNCEGQGILGPLGYAYDTAEAGSVQLFRCQIGADHFISTSATCEGQTVNGSLGYVIP